MTEPFSSDEQVPNEAAVKIVQRLLNKIEDQRRELDDAQMRENAYAADNARLRKALHEVRRLTVNSSIGTIDGGDICAEIDSALELLPFMGLTEESNENPN